MQNTATRVGDCILVCTLLSDGIDVALNHLGMRL